MNIAVIYGQRHKGNTYALTKLFLEHLNTADTLVSEFFLPEDSLGFCTGCLNITYVINQTRKPQPQ